MKILMVHPHDLFSPMEPWTTRVVHFAGELARKGHEVRVVYFPVSRREERVSGGVRFIPLDRAISSHVFVKNTFLLCKLSAWADVVHLQKSHFYASIPAILAAYLTGKPFHYDWDDWEEKIFDFSIHVKKFSFGLIGASFFVLERLIPFFADSVSVSSQALKDLSIRRGANARRIFLAPVGADLSQFYPGKAPGGVRKKFAVCADDVLVFYHGQLHSCHYVRMFLEASHMLCTMQLPVNVKFMILGTGGELQALKLYAWDLGIEDRVIFPGAVSHSEVPQYIAAADICVACFEDNEVTRCKSPLKIAEYMASGKPVVASDVGEVRNMLGDAGILVQSGSAEGIARGVLELLRDEKLRQAVAVKARQRAEATYNWSCSAANLEKAYQSVGA